MRPLRAQTSFSHYAEGGDGFGANATKAGLGFSERYTFDTLFNGLSIRINKADLSKLTRIEGVKAIWPQYPTAAAATRLVNKGMVVVASIKKSGANGP